MVKVVAKSKVKTNELEKYKDLVKFLIDETRKEEGCVSYDLFQDINNPSILTFIEEWKDEEALKRHMESKHFVKYVPMLGEFREGDGEVNIYKQIL
jgi:quinol monooxygenase YgiN